MPLLRGLTVRLFDNYVGHNLTSIVRNDFQSQFDLNEFGNTFPATNVNVHVPAGFVFGLEDEDCIVGLAKSSPNTLSAVAGHIYDFSTFNTTNCVLFDSSRSFSGYLVDTSNDSLTTPSEDGEFSVSFWVNPYAAPSGIYDILSKKLDGSSFHRFLIRYDSTGSSPVISFYAASEDAASEEIVSAGIVAGRWSLVTAKCSNKTIRLSVYGSDGFLSQKKLTSSVRLGCSEAGGNLYCGIGSDGSSNPLHAGSFYLQQVCFWKKEITQSEETELFNLGRGKTRFSDPAVPETFANFGLGDFKYGSTEGTSSWYVDLDSSGLVTKVYKNQEASPYIPCKNCDTEPCCYPNAMTDPSPDEIVLDVSWSASVGGCVPAATSFTMTRLPRQIIQGFIFGRTFESEKITLPCGGYLKFFLESTPYHWSKYRYRQYLGVETSFGGPKRFAKFNVTMGSALVRNNVTGGSNKFTSPSPGGVSFDFPYSDSFSDYASDIVTSGWTGYAAAILEEAFATDGCSTNSADAACIVADGYIFGTGVDRPERRLGSCGWQMGVSEFVSGSTSLSTQDSRYNYRISCGSPSVSNNTRVTPFDTLLHRPFSALARGLIGAHQENGEPVEANLPFSNFTAVLTPSEFVRPEPFTSLNQDAIRQQGPGDCIDCEVSATFQVDDSIPGGNPIGTGTTRKISNRQCPQKTLSGAVASVLSGSQENNGQPGTALLRTIGAAEGYGKGLASGAAYSDREILSSDEFDTIYKNWQTHLGGTLRPNGKVQFTSQIDDFDQGGSGREFIHFNIKSNNEVDPNSTVVADAIITKGTKADPYRFYVAGGVPEGEQLGVTIPVTAKEIKKIQPDHGTLSLPDSGDIVPIPGTTEITSSDCETCVASEACTSDLLITISGYSWTENVYTKYAAFAPPDPGNLDGACIFGGEDVNTCGIGNYRSNDPSSVHPASIQDVSVSVSGCSASKITNSSPVCPGIIADLEQKPICAAKIISTGTNSIATGVVYPPPSGTPVGYLGSVGFYCPSLLLEKPTTEYTGNNEFSLDFFECMTTTSGCTECSKCNPAGRGTSGPSGPSGVSSSTVNATRISVYRRGDGLLGASIFYTARYMEYDDMSVNTRMYWTCGPSVASLVYETDSVSHRVSVVDEVWEAKFKSSEFSDTCLRGEFTPATLTFDEESLVSRTLPDSETSTLSQLEAAQADRAGGRFVTRAASLPSLPAMGAKAWVPGTIHDSAVGTSAFYCVTDSRGPAAGNIDGIGIYGVGDVVLTVSSIDGVCDISGQSALPIVSASPPPDPIVDGDPVWDAFEPYFLRWFESPTYTGFVVFSSTMPPSVPFTLGGFGSHIGVGGNFPIYVHKLNQAAFSFTMTGGGPTHSGIVYWPIFYARGYVKDFCIDVVRQYSPSIRIDPGATFIVPKLIDWENATLSIASSYPVSGHFGYPDSYLVDFGYDVIGNGSDDYELTVDDTLLWRVNFTSGKSISIKPAIGLMEIRGNSGTKIIARYRLSGFPYSRWNRNEKNQMQLVSADWSIGDWPIYVTVEPVTP